MMTFSIKLVKKQEITSFFSEFKSNCSKLTYGFSVRYTQTNVESM
jgi:hypothetical protein